MKKIILAILAVVSCAFKRNFAIPQNHATYFGKFRISAKQHLTFFEIVFQWVMCPEKFCVKKIDEIALFHEY